MNSFERFGIEHLSPSSLELWRAQGGVWVRRYLFNQKEDSPAFWRGNAVETGLKIYLQTGDIERAVIAALASFRQSAMGEIAEGIEAEGSLVEPMVRQLQHWTPPSSLNATQVRVEVWLPKIAVPVIGFVDFAFEEEDDDLKTTKKLPSAATASHVRQVSLYRAARKRRGGLLYVTDKKHAHYPVTDDQMAQSIEELTAVALSLSNFLARMDTREDAARSLPVDWEHYRAPKVKVPLEELLTAG